MVNKVYVNIQRFQELTGDSDSKLVATKELNKGPRTKNRNIKNIKTIKTNNIILVNKFKSNT